jgi:diguanylate cyclase (GGDEF)-like protein/PAS domain S-box-containing protein
VTTETPDSLLVVDDTEMNRDMLSRRLRRHGYHVHVAETGEVALASVARERFALVLLDIEMPGLSGFDVLKTLRLTYSASELPVIMVTSRQQSRSTVDALSAGANDYITKPIDFAVAIARIETQLSRRRAELALRESEERYALAVRGANDGLWDWSLRTDHVYYSPRWKQMLGFDESEIGNTPQEWFTRVHPDEAELVKSAIDAHIAGQTSHFEAEHRMKKRDGTFLWMRSRGIAVRDTTDKAYRMAGSQTDITEGKIADALTGLPNRILFNDRLAHAIDRTLRCARRNEEYLCAVLFLDVDRFKLVNDSMGHMVGDELLVAVARRIERCLRSSDMVARLGKDFTLARLGGDEFTILLEELKHVGDALRVARRIQDALSQPLEVAGQEVFASVSIGIATTVGHETPGTVLRDADTAMYRAKAAGGSKVELFDDGMRQRAIARLQLETDMRRAIEREEFRVYYQPIIAVDSLTLVGFEALMRWEHPQRGLVSPAELIPVAEETGAIVAMGSWVLRQASQQMKRWQELRPDGPPLTVSVNLSGKQFLHAGLVDDVAAILHDLGLPASSLQLELTESTLMSRSDSAIAKLRELKALGVRLALDDFGTGYSSLACVHRFPLDVLKIDRSFVTSMRPDVAIEILRVIVSLARHLGLQVVAEGIETPEQLTQVQSLGCAYAQGYFFSPAVDGETATKALQADNWTMARPAPGSTLPAL